MKESMTIPADVYSADHLLSAKVLFEPLIGMADFWNKVVERQFPYSSADTTRSYFLNVFHCFSTLSFYVIT